MNISVDKTEQFGKHNYRIWHKFYKLDVMQQSIP